MRTFHALLMLLGILSALALGAGQTMAAPNASPVPCHGSGASLDGRLPHKAPDRMTKAMACCVACVAAPDVQPPERARLAVTAPPSDRGSQTLPNGRSLAPDPFPPR